MVFFRLTTGILSLVLISLGSEACWVLTGFCSIAMITLMKSYFFAIAFVFLLVLAGNVLAAPTPPEAPVAPTAPNAPTALDKSFALPEDAVQISEDLFRLRASKDPGTNENVEGYAIIHKKSHFRDAFARVQRPARLSGSTCYGYLASGAKWKWVEPWVVNPANNSSIADNDVFGIFSSSISKWEDATDGNVGFGAGVNVIGDGSTTSSALAADTVSPDDLNEAYFGEIEDSDTIAATIIWGIFSGPTRNRKLVEWDQIYNTVYGWSSTGEADKMDLDNIVTHEIGHSFGMNDLYTSSCWVQTMFGYADFGETIKRTLEAGDINGINKLY